LGGAITGVAVAAGPLIGGAIVEGLVWQWVFWLNVPVGIVITVLTIRKFAKAAVSSLTSTSSASPWPRSVCSASPKPS
jgi:MFS family permease